MAPTRVLLASFQAPTINNLVPLIYAQDYKRLARLTYDLYGNGVGEDNWDVHFHMAYLDIGAMGCNARIIPELWDRGDYFSSDFVTGGEVYVYAHFVSKDGVGTGFFGGVEGGMEDGLQEQDEYEMRMDPNLDIHTDAMAPLDPYPFFPGASFVGFGGPVPEEVGYMNPSSGLSTPLSTPPATPPPTNTQSILTVNIDDYPKLPDDVTPASYVKDRKAAKVDNTRDEFHTTERDIRSLSTARIQTIVRARMIAGKYGVDAKKPCDDCVKRGGDCRLLHPVLLTSAWKGVRGFNKITRVKCAQCVNWAGVKCNAAYEGDDRDISVGVMEK